MMQRRLLTIDAEAFPSVFRPLLTKSAVYDSSCSPQARVYFIDTESGYFLKTAPKGSLQTEAALTRYFHAKQLGAEVLAYVTDEQDWLLTRRVVGEDGTHAAYLAEPERLCDTTAEFLRRLHDTPFDGCPITDHTARYRATAEQGYRTGRCDLSLFPDNSGFSSVEEAWHIVGTYGDCLQTDTLLHGDYCLPNVIWDHWRFSGCIDVGNGGVGDRHVDIFWGVWTLQFNLKTDRYSRRFLDAYGRDRVDIDRLKVVAACEVFG